MFHVGGNKSDCTRNTTNLARPHPSPGKNWGKKPHEIHLAAGEIIVADKTS